MTQPLPKILPVNELKNTASIMKTCQESPVPIVITKNGYAEAVMMSVKLYEEMFAKMQTLPIKYFDTHPEYFSEIGGERVKDSQLCLTNPEVLQIAIENTRNIVDGVYLLKKVLGFKNIIIAVEDNKPDAIKILTKLTEKSKRKF